MSEIEHSQKYLPKLKKNQYEKFFINPQQFQNLVAATKDTKIKSEVEASPNMHFCIN